MVVVVVCDEAADEERDDRVRLGLRAADRVLRDDDAVEASGRRCPRARRAYRKPASSSVVCAIATSWVVTSGTADVDGPFETESVTVEPFEPSEPPLGVLAR